MTFDPLSILFLIVAIGFVDAFCVASKIRATLHIPINVPKLQEKLQFPLGPGATITSLLYRGRRPLKCPYCHVKSTYDIMATRVSKPKNSPKAKQKA